MVKCRGLKPALFLILYFCIFLVPVVSAEMGGYTVEPAPQGVDAGTPVDMVPVPFGQLPPREMATDIALTISPLLLFPVELFFLLKVFAFLGYRKIFRGNVLAHSDSNSVYLCIRENPGIYFMEISHKTHIKPGTLRYHLGILEIMGKISLLQTQGHSRYFENSGKFPVLEQKIIRYLRNETERSIFTCLLTNPETTRKDLENRLGISGAAVSWHMNRLREEGVLTINKTGRNARYELSPEVRRYLEKYCLNSPEAIAA
jgi:predicted transcriptional regulator